MAGQVCLIENILASLPIYYMSLFCMPKGVVKQIMSMECKFIWSGASAKQKAHKLIWNMAVREVERGGPGIGSITTKIKALFFKWLSRNHEGWEDHFINREHKPSFKNGLTLFTKRLSPIWSGIYTTINFWDDVWVGVKPLSKFYTRLYYLSSHKMAFIWNRDTRSSDFALALQFDWHFKGCSSAQR